MKTKMSLSAEMDLTQDSVVQLTCWCGQIALHELWGLGRTRLDRITRRKELLGSQTRTGCPRRRRPGGCDALQTEDIVVENVDDEKTVQTLSRSYKEQEAEFLKRAVMMAAGRKACRQSLNVLNEESVRQKCADAMAAATGSNLSPLRSGYASALQSSPDMGAKDQGGR